MKIEDFEGRPSTLLGGIVCNLQQIGVPQLRRRGRALVRIVPQNLGQLPDLYQALVDLVLRGGFGSLSLSTRLCCRHSGSRSSTLVSLLLCRGGGCDTHESPTQLIAPLHLSSLAVSVASRHEFTAEN